MNGQLSLARRMAALLAVALLSSLALAQSTARLQGTVSDQSGAVLPGARVKAINVGTNVERTTETDSSGFYSLPSLPIGTYRVEVEARGMGKQTITGLVLEVVCLPIPRASTSTR